MALRKRSYKGDKWLETAIHNARVDGQNERKSRQQDKKRRQAVTARLRAEEIHESWTDDALKIMDRKALGLNQISTRVVPEIRRKIREQNETDRAKAAQAAELEKARQDRILEKGALKAAKRASELHASEERDADRASAVAAAKSAMDALHVLMIEELHLIKSKLGSATHPILDAPEETDHFVYFQLRHHGIARAALMSAAESSFYLILSPFIAFLFIPIIGRAMASIALLCAVLLIIFNGMLSYRNSRLLRLSFNHSAANVFLRSNISSNHLRTCRGLRHNFLCKCAVNYKANALPENVRLELASARAMLVGPTPQSDVDISEAPQS